MPVSYVVIHLSNGDMIATSSHGELPIQDRMMAISQDIRQNNTIEGIYTAKSTTISKTSMMIHPSHVICMTGPTNKIGD